jgi:hypothetical protein
MGTEVYRLMDARETGQTKVETGAAGCMDRLKDEEAKRDW